MDRVWTVLKDSSEDNHVIADRLISVICAYVSNRDDNHKHSKTYVFNVI